MQSYKTDRNQERYDPGRQEGSGVLSPLVGMCGLTAFLLTVSTKHLYHCCSQAKDA
jgi:hypothetical protein